MIPKRVLVENFLSFGEPATEIEFGDDEPLWVLSGPNGTGKSAVFDAMTYCLFGCHRGGKGQGMEELIRHGENGFKVAFEFEFDGADYRIARTYKRSGRPTQRVERREAGGWQAVGGVNSPADVKGWAERTLGLDFEAFTASVLLRQGQADEIITATGARRLEILKRIIGAERFEQLSKRVHEKTRRCKDRLEDLQKQKVPEVNAEELDAVRKALEKAEGDRKLAHDAAKDAVDLVTFAKAWVKLDTDQKRLNGQIRAADDRAAAENRIRGDKVRLDDLTEVVPVLGRLVNLRVDLEKATQALDGRQKEAGRVTAALRAKQLREEIERDTEFINAADNLAAFPTDLEEQLSAARDKALIADGAHDAAGKAKAGIAALLEQAQDQQRKFATVGATCSLCGQPVSEEHARQEHERLNAAVRELEEKTGTAEDDEHATAEAKGEADAELGRLGELQRDRATVLRLFDERKRTRTKLGVTAVADELRLQLADKETEAKQCETAAAELASVDCATLERRQTEITKKLRADAEMIAAGRGEITARIEQLSAVWRARVETLDAAAVEALDAERRKLVVAKVADQFSQLEQDAALRKEWEKQLGGVVNEIAAIPEDCRVLVADAERDAILAKGAAGAADTGWQTAKEALSELTRQEKAYRELIAAIATAERQSDLHKKLDELLGKGGLQRELVRSAEREIVRLANDTVQNLSDGDLSIELDDAPEGDDEAFALRIRRADDPTPIGVSYLSGSQRFRVAVSVALAIGRYAAGQSRQLESVIIDEGFGSLDREGLDDMAAELNRLRQHLRRIILVSHQEEFADRFPVVIRLARGENGTTATPVRR
jgi:DNA repair exonuclease SbcCD ATPase subunit